MSQVELVWVSYMDEELALRSVASFAETRLPRRVVVNGRWRGPDLPHDVDITETGRLLNLADAFNLAVSQSSSAFVLFVDTDMIWPSQQSVAGLARLIAGMDPLVAVCALPQVDVLGRSLASGASLPAPLRRRLSTDTVGRAPALGGTIYRTAALRSVGGLAHMLDWGDHDVDLVFRVLQGGWWVSESDQPYLIHDYMNVSKPQRSGRTFRALCTRASLLRARTSSGAYADTLCQATLIAARAATHAVIRPSQRKEQLRRGIEAVLACFFCGRLYIPPTCEV